ncbi:efflux RND transporter periplasmic adaptor subunit [Marinobacter sp. F4218]|uniref:efflux RND transporter periplasmic adaptor subunit n=1 Tax=Marinobacter sp. F4218 TaxID=2862868 RepID=UPI001C6308D1|nr:efflux RND transporter periplasmic adaptor subunit [Marinobacter sp. F4218]MBW7472593.1 efflux RND transporter periplasmic adaptor subunit [Marinobacter sp. F4218]
MSSSFARKEHVQHLPVFVLALSLIVGCSEPSEPPQAEPPSVSVVVVEDSEVRPSREFVARTAASAKADITARIEAEIREILFEEGARVSRGQVLFRLEDTTASASLKQAEAELAAARAEVESATKNLRRGEEVAGKGFLSDADLDKLKDRFNAAQSQLQSAEAAVDKARTNLDYAEIRAPFDGWIGKLNFDVGAVVNPSSGPITEVLVTDPIYVQFEVNEADYVSYRRANSGSTRDIASQLSLSLTLPDGESYGQNGVLDFADVRTDNSTGTVAMRAVFPNPGAILLPGLYVTLLIEGQSGEVQALVPQMAIQETIEGKFVLLVSDEQQVAQRFVTTGPRRGAMMVVESGLEAGDRVIVEGLQKVRSGITVNPVQKWIDPQTGALRETEEAEQ